MINLKVIEETRVKDYRHYFDGLDGIRCGYDSKPDETSRVSLSWDSVNCPSCRTLKQDWEPESVEIDTKGD